MLDKEASKVYRKLQCAKDEFEVFSIIDNLKPDLAKRVFIRYVMNQSKPSLIRQDT